LNKLPALDPRTLHVPGDLLGKLPTNAQYTVGTDTITNAPVFTFTVPHNIPGLPQEIQQVQAVAAAPVQAAAVIPTGLTPANAFAGYGIPTVGQISPSRLAYGFPTASAYGLPAAPSLAYGGYGVQGARFSPARTAWGGAGAFPRYF
jgi:hypothetical protein